MLGSQDKKNTSSTQKSPIKEYVYKKPTLNNLKPYSDYNKSHDLR